MIIRGDFCKKTVAMWGFFGIILNIMEKNDTFSSIKSLILALLLLRR
jgi:hypothetical protein